MRKVRIKKLPKAQAGNAGNGYTNSVPEQVSNWGGADVGDWNLPDMSTKRMLGPVSRDEANIEAEKGEVAYGDINGDNFAETYLIGGQRHSNGGTPLNVPEGTFIYSDFAKMKIKDPNLLAFFGKTNAKGKTMKKGGFTPAEIAKQYDVNKYRAILEDPNSDKHDVKTAELMIKEYQMKLGGLALAQEAQKNYEQGIPEVAYPYMQKMGISEEDLIQQPPVPQMPMQDQFMRYGGDISIPPITPMVEYKGGGELPSYQTRGEYNQNNLPGYRGEDVDTRWSGSADHARVYQAITDSLVDPQTGEINEFGKFLAEQTRAALAEKERYKGKSGRYSRMWDDLYGEGSAAELSDQEILSAFANHQQRNLMLNASGIEAGIYKDSNGQLKSVAQITQTTNPQTGKNYTTEEAKAIRKKASDMGYTSLNKAFSVMGAPLGDSKMRRLEQATFHGFNRMLEHKDERPDLAEQIAPWTGGLQRGMGDEPGEGKRKQVSPIDAFYTNTTAGHLVGLGAQGEPEEPEDTETVIEEDPTDPAWPEIQAAGQQPISPWRQDVDLLWRSKMNESKIPRQQPWAPDLDRTEVQLPRVDPTRELAAISESVAQGADALSSFVGPQQTSARLAGNQAASAIANTMARYNNQNVDLEAKEEMTNAQLEEQYKARKFARDKGLYDDTMRGIYNAAMMGIGFDTQQTQLFNQMLTNMYQTDALNQMTEQFNIDPSVGGKVYHTGVPKPIKPERSQTVKDTFQYWKEQGMNDETAYKMTRLTTPQGASALDNSDIGALMSAYRQKGGLVMGSNVFPFMFY